MPNATAVERKYVLTKVAAGDYLLPSNDGETVWRICCYRDGPSQGLDIPSDRDFWGCWRWTGGSEFVDAGDDAWERWELVSQLHDTCNRAIQAALAESS